MSPNPSSSVPLRIIVNEDSEVDFHLLETEFRRTHFACELKRTSTKEAFIQALETFHPDIVISDFDLPGFSGLAALDLTRSRMPPPPFIFLTRTPGAEIAVECLHRGAADYVLKNRLPRIVPVIQTALSRRHASAEPRMPDELLRVTHDLFAIATHDGIMQSANRAWTNFLGYARTELIGYPARAFVHPDDASIFDGWWQQILEHAGAPSGDSLAEAGHPPPDCECRFIHKHAGPRHLRWSAVVPAGDGRVYLHGHDMTGRKQTEPALSESEIQFRRIAGSAPVLIWMADADGRFFYFNDLWLEFTGRSLAEEAGQGCFEGLHPDDREALMNRFHARFVERAAFRAEFRLRRHDGAYRWLINHATPCSDALGVFTGFVGFCFDATEQHDLETLLAHRARKQSVLASFSRVALAPHSFGELIQRAPKLILDTLRVDGGCIFTLNPGDPRLVLRHFACRQPCAQPDDFGRATDGMLARRQAIRLSDDPENFPGAKALATLGMRSGLACPIGAPPHIHAFVVAFSLEPRVFSTEAVDFIQGLANVLGTVHQRERVEAALAESEQKLLQAQKLEISGLMASGVAHDFNNLLTAIRGYGELLREKLPDASGDIQASIDGLLKTTSRASSLVQRLLAFTRQQALTPERIDLNTLVLDLRDLIVSFLPSGIGIELELHPQPVSLMADRNQIEQVLINLAINARDAMPDGGTLTIRTAVRQLASGEIPSLNAGSYAELSVQDTGIGMPDEVKAKIFDPFFTTKAPGRGTGLGLSVCLNVIRHFHGDLLLETAPGHGTTFQALLPRDSDAGDALRGHGTMEGQTTSRPPSVGSDARSSELMKSVKGGGEYVYLVEDDDAIREVTNTILESLGYRVRAFPSAGSLLASIAQEKNSDVPALLISDIVMPDMDGRKLGRHIKKFYPDLAVLFMSGYVESPRQLDDDGFIAKPFTRETLARKVRLALDSR